MMLPEMMNEYIAIFHDISLRVIATDSWYVIGSVNLAKEPWRVLGT